MKSNDNRRGLVEQAEVAQKLLKEVAERNLKIHADLEAMEALMTARVARKIVDKVLFRKEATRLVYPSPRKPPLTRLLEVNDLLPSPTLRKSMRKMLADQAVHIGELQEAGRPGAAKWQKFATWLLWFWYVLRSPMTSLLSYARKLGS
jgi:hypothetical protein